MTVQGIRLFGDPVLSTPATAVVDFDAELRRLVADLLETMPAAPGTGLAAPQIGAGLRVFVYRGDEGNDGHQVNPRVSSPSDEQQDDEEGCLSIPGLFFDCRRHRHVIAGGHNMWGDPI